MPICVDGKQYRMIILKDAQGNEQRINTVYIKPNGQEIKIKT